ncbi:MAG TPA: hypothetical protein VGS09_10635 [Actinomycetota bacterium]|nr:hypothetical protein [Actinomycetota bacterium]
MADAFGGRAHRIGLGPLSSGALDQVLRSHLHLSLPRSFLLRLHKASGGNPFFALT